MWPWRKQEKPASPEAAPHVPAIAGEAGESPTGEASTSLEVSPPDGSAAEVAVAEPAGSPEAAPEGAEESKGFWAKTWEVLNRPVFTLDRETLAGALERTRGGLVDRVRKLGNRWSRIDEDMLEELEEILLEADLGVDVTEGAIAHLRAAHRKGEIDPGTLPKALGAYLSAQLAEARPLAVEPGTLQVIMLVGVNGVGKTTTLGKLARRYQLEGRKVLIAAADTFRAAAIDQLLVWAERAGVDVVRHQEGGDAAAVVYDALQAARARGVEVLLVDTAGRLHNKAHLMTELQKIGKILDREAPGVPREVLLVLDATTGQNGLRQAEVFREATTLTGVVLTKLDGTARGGVIFGIQKAFGLPVKLVGLGEKVDDLKDFETAPFVGALFEEIEK
jgi:fused signal recognition particle receptor